MFNKKKLTVQEKLAKRKFVTPNRFLNFLLVKILLKPFVSGKFHVTYHYKDRVPKKGAFFLIFNHQSRMDYIWTTTLAYPRRLNFVVGYNEHFKKHFKHIFNWMHVIPKKQFTTDLVAISGITRVIKNGGAVCFSPEGISSIYGQQQPIVRGTGKFFKHFNVPVYLVKSGGGYLSCDKVSLIDRYGKIDASIELLLSPEQLSKMSGDEIDNYIDKSMWHDDYQWTKENKVKWDAHGTICSHLHDIDYQCPKCGSEFTMIGEGNTLKCTKCGNGAEMDDYFIFHPFKDSIIPESPSKWVEWERGNIIKAIRKDPNYSFKEKVKLAEIPTDHYLDKEHSGEVTGEGTITINHDGVTYEGTRNSQPYTFHLGYDRLFTPVYASHVGLFAFYVDGEYFEFYPERPCAGKVLLLVEEMHRLHVNKWKNFPWFDHLYK